MNIEAKMIISLLKLTREGPVSHELIKRDSNVPLDIVQKLLKKLQNDGLVYVRGKIVEASGLQRVKLAILALQSGADLERTSGFLQWKEFESIAAIAFERNGYRVEKNLHFKHAGRRFEIDIVGCRKPLAICVDCKHWHHGLNQSTLKRIVEEQVERTSALAQSLPNPAVKIECLSGGNVRLVPAVLSLVAGRFKFYNNVPVVPILQLQDFISQLPAYVDSLKHFQTSGPSFKIES
jgi:Holliday junction resolvase-like predicted endonuclease